MGAVVKDMLQCLDKASISVSPVAIDPRAELLTNSISLALGLEDGTFCGVPGGSTGSCTAAASPPGNQLAAAGWRGERARSDSRKAAVALPAELWWRRESIAGAVTMERKRQEA